MRPNRHNPPPPSFVLNEYPLVNWPRPVDNHPPTSLGLLGTLPPLSSMPSSRAQRQWLQENLSAFLPVTEPQPFTPQLLARSDVCISHNNRLQVCSSKYSLDYHEV